MEHAESVPHTSVHDCFLHRCRREEDNTTCVFCGKIWTKCECGIVVKPTNPLDPYCPVCHLRKEFCTCDLICTQCNRYPCICNSGGYTGGNHGGGSNPEPPKEEKKILPDVKIFLPASKYPGYDVLKDCYKVCDYVLDVLINGDNAGSEVKRFIKRKDANGNFLPFNSNADVSIADMFNLINASLDAKRPLKAGLDYWNSGLNNGDYITDHWVVISGRVYDTQTGQYYFTYIETARNKNSAAAAVGDNRLYYDIDKGTISGERYKGDDTYFINQIKIDNSFINK